MAYDRPSWRDIDKMKDKSSRRKRNEGPRKEISEHSTRYTKYKADLNRLFDQGMAGDLLKKPEKEKKEEPAPAPKPKAKTKVITRKESNRIPRDTRASTNRLKLIRSVIDAQDRDVLCKALDELIGSFGMPDDWEVLVRVLEHDDEDLVLKAVQKMKDLLMTTTKVPRRATLKERLRSIGQTAGGSDLRELASELEDKL